MIFYHRNRIVARKVTQPSPRVCSQGKLYFFSVRTQSLSTQRVNDLSAAFLDWLCISVGGTLPGNYKALNSLYRSVIHQQIIKLQFAFPFCSDLNSHSLLLRLFIYPEIFVPTVFILQQCYQLSEGLFDNRIALFKRDSVY